MNPVIAAIVRHAAAHPRRAALTDGARDMTYADLHHAAGTVAALLRARTSRAVALHLDNAPAWVVADLALIAARLPCVPLPGFFSSLQLAHAVCDAGVECVITDQPARCLEYLSAGGLAAVRDPDLLVAGLPLACIRIPAPSVTTLPAGTQKVTYTSGTTGSPRGVCLDGDALSAVARSLGTACGLGARDRHLSVLPLATLLENVGIYASLISGACCVLPPLQEIGFQGATGIRAERLIAALSRHGATTAIVVPQLLQALIAQIESGSAAPAALRFLAVGGAVVAPALLARAAALGLPAYEGYGLSECASVLTLNTPGANLPGSVGRPLPHVAIEIAPDGEILASGATLIGYSGGAPGARRWPTGDTGYIDAGGYLHVNGRKKDIFVTSYGRNISPEWIEAELLAESPILQAWAHGESRPWVCAVVTARDGCQDAAVRAAVAHVNERLPAYARIRKWLRSRAPFSCASGELTANGRLRRQVLASRYQSEIATLYEKELHEFS
jgi:long-subunit acyl-CoA synthetase (AMP-forming)